MPGDLGPFAPLNMPIRELLFSFEGRIPRSIWWAASAILNFAWLLIFALLINLSDAQPAARMVLGPILIGLMLLVIWTNLALHIKRLHDTGSTGWFCLLALIPYLGWLIVVLIYGFRRGTAGSNEYGADPLAASVPSP